MIKEVSSPKLKNPIFICAWPGMGEVAYKTALFLKEALEFRVFAKLEAQNFFKPSAVIVEKGVIELPTVPAGFFYYKKLFSCEFILFLGEAQPPLDKAEDLAKEIIRYVKKFKVKLILSFAAKPEAIDHKTDSSVWITATHSHLIEKFKSYPVKILREGQISGLNGLILGVAKRQKIEGVCFLAEIPFYTVQIENPKASQKILKILNDYFDLHLDLTPVVERAKFVEEEIDKLIAYLKGEIPHTDLPLSEEDIEKIKKDLATYTKLPHSAREKIERLFEEAKKDISKARELKEELDRWNVYKEYEDRFLDLFKKRERNSGH